MATGQNPGAAAIHITGIAPRLGCSSIRGVIVIIGGFPMVSPEVSQPVATIRVKGKELVVSMLGLFLGMSGLLIKPQEGDIVQASTWGYRALVTWESNG